MAFRLRLFISSLNNREVKPMYMFKYVMKRLGLMLLSFSVIMLICFVLIKLLPIVVTVQAGEDAKIVYAQLEARRRSWLHAELKKYSILRPCF